MLSPHSSSLRTMHKSNNVVVLVILMLAFTNIRGDESFGCKGLPYPELCTSALGLGIGGSIGGIHLPDVLGLLLRDSLGVVGKTFETASGLIGHASPGYEQAALSDCTDLLDITNDQLTNSLKLSSGSDTIKTFLSASLTNQETCMESLSNTNGIVRTQLSIQVQRLARMVTNSLALVSKVSDISGQKTHTKPGNRKLLSFPSWLRAADRKLLQDYSEDGLVNSANVVVSLDGSGDYMNITAAIEDAPDHNTDRYIIHVKAGTYYENIDIKKKKTNIMIFGDGMDVTIVSGNKNFIDGTTTFRSATFAVTASGFIARDMTFENTAGAEKHQAVALRCGSDMSVFYRCSFKGYQDTLYAHSLRQFYRDCKIYGTVDFMFGNAAAVFQNCEILARKPLANQIITVTAQGRKDPNQNTGIAIQGCNITAAPDLGAENAAYATYLGRPWKEYSRAVVMESFLDNNIRAQGWVPWNASNFALDTLYFGEYMNYGPGAGLQKRVNWQGFHAMNDSNEAAQFTVAEFINGNSWLPSTGVTYIAGLKS